MSASPVPIVTKRRRVTQACDFCHRRGIKCKGAQPHHNQGAPASCLTCIEYGQECTRRRQPKVRGTKPRNARNHARLPRVEGDLGVGSSQLAYGLNGVPLKDTDRDGHSVPVIKDRQTVNALLDVYLDTIHPIFPFFCERDLWLGWRDGSFPATQSDYVSLVCMCALSAHHVGCGALFTDDTHLPAAAECASLSQEYLAEAVRTVPLDFSSTTCVVHLIRSYGLLALLGAQSNRRAMAHKYLGLYHGLCAHWNLHDEAQWPPGMDECETEVRRRLWWLMYRLEVHTTCVFGSMVRCSEVYAAVEYPTGAHHPAFVPGRDGDFEDWFSGWNATTDLYRVLEHVIAEFRVRRRPRTSILGGGAGGAPAPSAIADKLSRIQDDILPHFASAYSRSSSDSGRNRCGFQASHIVCTIHLARIISTLGNGDFRSACQTADSMIATIGTIPVEYIRAIGSPLLQQLAGVGHMLAGVAGKRQLPPENRGQCKAAIASIILFLSGLAENNATAAVEEERLTARLAEVELDAARDADVAGDSGFVGEGEALDLPEYDMEGFLADLNELVSANMARSLTWPYEPPIDDLQDE